VFYELGDVLIALHRYRDDATAAGGDFLDVGEGLFVPQDGVGVVWGPGWRCRRRGGFRRRGRGAVLHLAGRVAFGLDAGDFLELEGAFEGDDKPSPSRTLWQNSSLSRAILEILWLEIDGQRKLAVGESYDLPIELLFH
jgi:hypothetical protein